MTQHKIIIAVDDLCNKYEWADRIDNALSNGETVSVSPVDEYVIIRTANIMQTIDALKNDGFDI